MSVEHSPFCASQESTFASLTGATPLPCDCGVLAASTPIVPDPEPESRVAESPSAQPQTFAEVLATNVQTPTLVVTSPLVPPVEIKPPAAPDTPAERQIKDAVQSGEFSARVADGLLLRPLGGEPQSPTDIPVDSVSPLDSVLDSEPAKTPAATTPPKEEAPPPAEAPKKKRTPRKKKETPPPPPTAAEPPSAGEAPKAPEPPKEPDLFDAPPNNADDEEDPEAILANESEEVGDKAPPAPPPATAKSDKDGLQLGHVGFVVAPEKLKALYVGIDIGLMGYITELGPSGELVAFHPMPTSGGERPVYDEPGIARIVSAWPLKAKKVYVMLEQQQTIGKLFRDDKEIRIGSKAHFKKGMGYGILRGVLATVQRFFPNLVFEEVSAKKWKKAMGISGGAPDDVKKKAITKTGGLYPHLDLRPLERSQKSRVPSGDKAESVLISRYVFLQTTGAIDLLTRAGEPTPAELAARQKLIDEEAETANQDASSASDKAPDTDEGNAGWLANMNRLMTQTNDSEAKAPSAPKKSARNTKKTAKTTKKSKGKKKPKDDSDGLKSLLSGI